MDYKQTTLEEVFDSGPRGDFACGGSWAETALAIPDIVVEGYGVVGLPLSQPAAAELIKVSDHGIVGHRDQAN